MAATRPHATGTVVSPAKSQEDIEKILARYGATGFGVIKRAGEAFSVGFEIEGRR